MYVLKSLVLMNFAQDYFTRLDAKGPNADFLQSYSARLTYAIANQVNMISSFPITAEPYAKDAEMPVLSPIQAVENEDRLEETDELVVSRVAGLFVENSEFFLRKDMRVRERMAAYILIIQNGLRFKKDTQTGFQDVDEFVKGLQYHKAVFPLHPALVVGPGFNLSDSIDNPYYGTHHTTWSLQKNPFAFKVVEMYEKHVRRLVTDENEKDLQFMQLLRDVFSTFETDIEQDPMDVLSSWARDDNFSFAPIVRLYVSHKESPAPFTNTLPLLETRLTTAFITSST